MISLIVIIIIATYVLRSIHLTQRQIEPMSKSIHDKLERIWRQTNKDIQNHQWQRAERNLLSILRFDKKDASAYNRLGIIYAKQKDYEDAIKCFEIAKSIKPGASNYHNLGLLYLELEKYDKAQIAFEEAIAHDENSAMRYVALAKVYSKTDKYKNAVEVLEKAVELDPSSTNYKLLAEAAEAAGDTEDANEYTLRSRQANIEEYDRQVNSKFSNNKTVV